MQILCNFYLPCAPINFRGGASADAVSAKFPSADRGSDRVWPCKLQLLMIQKHHHRKASVSGVGAIFIFHYGTNRHIPRTRRLHTDRSTDCAYVQCTKPVLIGLELSDRSENDFPPDSFHFFFFFFLFPFLEFPVETQRKNCSFHGKVVYNTRKDW